MWQDNSDIQYLEWQEAKDYCSNLSLGGYSDWRLPNRAELLGIVDNGRSYPAIDPIFENTKNDWYWSSSSLAYDNGYAWTVHFLYGYTNYYGKYFSWFVRCVR